MKNHLLVYLLLFGAGITTNSFGQKTVTESFDYAIGDINGKGNASDGWGGAWTKAKGEIDVVDGNLGSDIVGKSIKTVAGSDVVYFREFGEKWVDDGNSVWISFYMKRENTALLEWGGISLFNGEGEDLFIGCPWQSATVGFGADKTNIFNTDLNFITVKLVMNGTVAPDKAYMWVNYNGTNEPDTTTAEASQVWGTDGFTKIRIGSSAAYSINYDKIRIESNFQSSSDLVFTTTGSCAPYITFNNWYSLQADSTYKIEKTGNPIVVDGIAESAWSEANARVIKKVAHEKKLGDVLNLSGLPQTEDDLYATYKALWTENGVYMLIDVKDDMVRYQNPDYQWENDGIEFYFAKGVGEGKIQLIIPAMVGTTNPAKPAAKDFESGSATGSDASYKVFGFDTNNWDETTFNWAIKKTATGYTMEVYMDKDIVTNGNSDTNYGLGKMFAGDVNVDEADEKINTNDPALFVRESTLCMLGNSNQEYAGSNNYGWFKMVNEITTRVSTLSSSDFNVFYSSANKQITIRSNSVVSATLYTIAGQAMISKYMDGKMNVANIKSGIYIINAKDANGNRVGSSKVAIF